jgi:hypothetical protein
MRRRLNCPYPLAEWIFTVSAVMTDDLLDRCYGYPDKDGAVPPFEGSSRSPRSLIQCRALEVDC